MELQKSDLLYKPGWPRSLTFTPPLQYNRGEDKVERAVGHAGVTRPVGKYLLHRGTSMGCSQVSAVVPGVPPLPPPLKLVLTRLFLTLSFLTLLCMFCFVLNRFSQKCHQLHWWAQLCDVVGSWQSQLEPAGTGWKQPCLAWGSPDLSPQRLPQPLLLTPGRRHPVLKLV